MHILGKPATQKEVGVVTGVGMNVTQRNNNRLVGFELMEMEKGRKPKSKGRPVELVGSYSKDCDRPITAI
jgi:hypothetical protein